MTKSIEKYIEKIRKKGIRMTTQRLAILEYLAIEGNHPTAYEVYEALHIQHPNISIATIYNNLNFFKEAGIVIELALTDSSTRYDLTDSKHYHAFCNVCKKVYDFNLREIQELTSIVDKKVNFKVLDHKFQVSGICEECQ